MAENYQIQILKNKSIHDVRHKLNDSSMRYDLLKVREIYLQGRSISIKNRELIRF